MSTTLPTTGEYAPPQNPELEYKFLMDDTNNYHISRVYTSLHKTRIGQEYLTGYHMVPRYLMRKFGKNEWIKLAIPDSVGQLKARSPYHFFLATTETSKWGSSLVPYEVTVLPLSTGEYLLVFTVRSPGTLTDHVREALNTLFHNVSRAIRGMHQITFTVLSQNLIHVVDTLGSVPPHNDGLLSQYLLDAYMPYRNHVKTMYTTCEEHAFHLQMVDKFQVLGTMQAYETIVMALFFEKLSKAAVPAGAAMNFIRYFKHRDLPMSYKTCVPFDLLRTASQSFRGSFVAKDGGRFRVDETKTTALGTQQANEMYRSTEGTRIIPVRTGIYEGLLSKFTAPALQLKEQVRKQPMRKEAQVTVHKWMEWWNMEEVGDDDDDFGMTSSMSVYVMTPSQPVDKSKWVAQPPPILKVSGMRAVFENKETVRVENSVDVDNTKPTNIPLSPVTEPQPSVILGPSAPMPAPQPHKPKPKPKPMPKPKELFAIARDAVKMTIPKQEPIIVTEQPTRPMSTAVDKLSPVEQHRDMDEDDGDGDVTPSEVSEQQHMEDMSDDEEEYDEYETDMIENAAHAMGYVTQPMSVVNQTVVVKDDVMDMQFDVKAVDQMDWNIEDYDPNAMDVGENDPSRQEQDQAHFDQQAAAQMDEGDDPRKQFKLVSLKENVEIKFYKKKGKKKGKKKSSLQHHTKVKVKYLAHKGNIITRRDGDGGDDMDEDDDTFYSFMSEGPDDKKRDHDVIQAAVVAYQQQQQPTMFDMPVMTSQEVVSLANVVSREKQADGPSDKKKKVSAEMYVDSGKPCLDDVGLHNLGVPFYDRVLHFLGKSVSECTPSTQMGKDMIEDIRRFFGYYVTNDVVQEAMKAECAYVANDQARTYTLKQISMMLLTLSYALAKKQNANNSDAQRAKTIHDMYLTFNKWFLGLFNLAVGMYSFLVTLVEHPQVAASVAIITTVVGCNALFFHMFAGYNMPPPGMPNIEGYVRHPDGILNIDVALGLVANYTKYMYRQISNVNPKVDMSDLDQRVDNARVFAISETLYNEMVARYGCNFIQGLSYRLDDGEQYLLDVKIDVLAT